MRKELIKFIMERADKEYNDDFPISHIPEWINEFFDQNQPERLNPETQCDCTQCKLDRFHQEKDLEFYKFQIENRKTSWCPKDNLLECQKNLDAIVRTTRINEVVEVSRND